MMRRPITWHRCWMCGSGRTITTRPRRSFGSCARSPCDTPPGTARAPPRSLEILGEFDRLSIDALVLKGAALAWMIYPSPGLRPMVDLDVLVPRARAGEAQAALGRLGFGAEPEPRRFRRNAHHLPVAQRLDDGLPVNVEIHVDALSRDAPSTIATNNLTEPPQPFMLNGTRAIDTRPSRHAQAPHPPSARALAEWARPADRHRGSRELRLRLPRADRLAPSAVRLRVRHQCARVSASSRAAARHVDAVRARPRATLRPIALARSCALSAPS